jgi:hypothetical protein
MARRACRRRVAAAARAAVAAGPGASQPVRLRRTALRGTHLAGRAFVRTLMVARSAWRGGACRVDALSACSGPGTGRRRSRGGANAGHADVTRTELWPPPRRDGAAQCAQPCDLRAASQGTSDPLAGRLWDAAKNLSALEAVAPRLAWPVCVAGSNAQPTGGVRESHSVTALGELAPALWRSSSLAPPSTRCPRVTSPSARQRSRLPCPAALWCWATCPACAKFGDRRRCTFHPNDHEALYATLRRLIAGKSLRERYARKARARALQFSPERMLDTYLGAYRQVLAPRGSGAEPGSTPASRRKETVCAS